MPFFNRALLMAAAILLVAGCSSVRMPGVATEDNKVRHEEKIPRSYDNALVLMQSGDYQAAIPVLKAFIVKRPALAGPYLNLGIAYRLTKQDDAAVDALNQALKLNPENPATWHQLAILYRNQGDFNAALDAYRKALELDQDYALAHRNIGILYDLYLQQPVLALQHYRKYLALKGEEDTTVNRWVVDLERRSGKAQARTTP
ncbi:hypothetical protein MNBD_GAMMA14-2039 [hydrothermal vent metagenome]|uniref:Uncharacterized protein n=1 Tax=hydrothermal vent metagenome TaxID=652676 RepID=A0A3B0Y6J4_9ZZZZ